MKAGDPNIHSSFKSLSLKRDKQQFRMSTAAQTLNRDTFYQEGICQQDNQYKDKESKEQLMRSCDTNQKNQQERLLDIDQVEQSTIYKYLTKLVNSQRQYLNDTSRIQNHRTHCYISYGSLSQQNNMRYSVTNDEDFPPKFIKQIYDRQCMRRPGENINYHFGNLEKSGYLYFSVQNCVILVNSLCYIQPQQYQQPIILQIADHALSISEISITDLQIDDIQRHPFGQKQMILAIWLQWSVLFYSFEPCGVIKLVDLQMRHETSCGAVTYFDYCKKGNIYYMNQGGDIGKIQLFHRNLLGNFKWGRKFSIREYFYRFSNNTKRKRQKLLNPSIISRARQLFQDAKYYFSQKKTKGLSIICDRERQLLYTLVQTSICHISANREQNESHRQIRVYSIAEQDNGNILDKIQKGLSYGAPKIITQLTEQKLYLEIGVHLFNNMSLMKFQIVAIYVPHYFDVAVQYYAHNKSNLIVILSNGSRLYLYLSQNSLILNQIINLPNLDQLFSIENRNTKNQSITISQQQPTKFRLLSHRYHLQDKTLALIGQYRRDIIALMLTQMQGEQHCNEEQVVLVWQQSLDWDRKGAISNNMFVGLGEYSVYLGRELERNVFKKKLSEYKYNQYQIINRIQNIGQKSIKSQRIKMNTIRQSPQSRQILHYPQQYLMVHKSKICGVIKLRPIDIVVGSIYREVNGGREGNVLGLMESQFDLGRLYRMIEGDVKMGESKIGKLEILVMFVQIFCDVDGVYYFQQHPTNSIHQPSQQQKTSHPKHDNRPSNATIRNDNIGSYPRRTNSTLVINNHPNNLRDPQHMMGNQLVGERITAKINTVNTFQKFGYCDMNKTAFIKNNSKQKSGKNRTRENGSILKLILKLMIFAVRHYSPREETKSDANQHQQQNQQVNQLSKIAISKIDGRQLQQSVLIYLARLIVSLWVLKIGAIQNMVYQYIGDVCSRMLGLVDELEEQLMVMSFPDTFMELRDLCRVLVQYNLMLGIISNRPNIQYGEGIASRRQIFEQSIFFSLQNEKDVAHVATLWRELIPNYFGVRVFKASKLQTEIAGIGDRQERKVAVLENYKSMPPYLLYCYFRDGTLNRSQIESLLQMSSSQQSKTNIKNTNHLIITDAMSAHQRVQYAIAEMNKNDRNLYEKQFLIGYALQYINLVRNMEMGQIAKKKKQLMMIQKIIRIQQLIYKQIIKYEREHLDTDENLHAKNLVNLYLLTPVQLKVLIKQLKNPILQLIYCCNFWDEEIDICHNLKQLIIDKGRYIKSCEVRQKLVEVFRSCYGKLGLRRLPVKYLLGVLDQLAHHEILEEELTWIIKQNDEKLIRQKFWVPLFLCEWGWNQQVVLDYYIEQAKKQYKSYQVLASQKLFMYYWISGYSLVKFRYMSGRRIFQISTQFIFGSSGGKQHQGKHLQQNASILVDFIRENLY